NIEIDTSGNTIGRKGPKKSHDIFFTRDHWFELQVGDERLRMNDFDIIQDYFNRSKMRIPLAHQTFRAMGTPTHRSFPVRVERNGEFHGTYAFVNGGNEQFLEELGLSPEAALYKMRYAFSQQSGFKKMTRRYEDNSDLEALFAGFDLPTELARAAFLLDHVNIPAMVNLLAGLVLTSHEDCCNRNLYAYRDTEGTGEWQVLPYDFDGSLGRGGHTSDTLQLRSVGVDFHSRGNSLFAALDANVPGFRSMYLRRLRTVLDEFLQPPGTPAEDLWFEQQIDEMAQQLAPDALLDYEKYGGWGTNPTWPEQVNILRNEYFPRRRVLLYGLVGDMDLSGTIDRDDVDDFALGLAAPAAYQARYGVPSSLRGDTNYDLRLDFDDIDRFVALVNGAPQWAAALPPAQLGAPEIEFGAIDV
ncbi:MAG: hypothetical protein A2W31_14090, partial [Planctomycetes bacterium RBG_16_64_10]